ncbi:hypothetical protein QC283_13310 [Streptomyces sp. DH41]|nr:SCO6880 family protein [Streptomyces sp. DH41]MDG9723769.1 hypothetical protein [Streptomyces sp. DH41]
MPRARPAVKGAGGGQVGAAAVLVRELHAMHGSLSSASLQVVEWLTPRALAHVVRTAYDPEAQLMLATRNSAAQAPDWQGLEPGVAPELAGPAYAETDWGTYRHDGAWTVSYQVRTWPQTDVYATFLQPMLRPRQNARRSLSIVYEPIGPRRARQDLAREKAKREAARKLRARTGQDESADELLESQKARAQDVARAMGQGVVRLTAVLAVTVTDPGELETACAELQADAAASGLELRRMWGAQDAGFAAAALPLGQGLPDRRRSDSDAVVHAVVEVQVIVDVVVDAVSDAVVGAAVVQAPRRRRHLPEGVRVRRGHRPGTATRFTAIAQYSNQPPVKARMRLTFRDRDLKRLLAAPRPAEAARPAREEAGRG